MSDCAPSWTPPPGVPSGSRSKRPSAGSAVVAVIPAISSAFVLTQALCPSRLVRKTGRSGETRSRSARLGTPPGKSSMDQPPPRIQLTSGCVRAYASTISRYASRPRESCSSQRRRARPPWTGWTCESPKPGVTVRPRSSMTRVPAPMCAGHGGVRPDGHDPSVADGHGRGPAPGGIDGRDPATGQDEVGGVVSGHPGSLCGRGSGRGDGRRMTGPDGLVPGIPSGATRATRPAAPSRRPPVRSRRTRTPASRCSRRAPTRRAAGRTATHPPARPPGPLAGGDVATEPMDRRPPRRPRPRSGARAPRRPTTARSRRRPPGASATARRPRAGTGSRCPLGRSPATSSARHVSTNQPPSGCGSHAERGDDRVMRLHPPEDTRGVASADDLCPPAPRRLRPRSRGQQRRPGPGRRRAHRRGPRDGREPLAHPRSAGGPRGRTRTT